jgi:hypothetical protein
LAAKKATSAKETKDKLQVKQFKDGSLNYWVNNKHYYLENKEIKLAAGGLICELEVEHLRKYLKTKKLV